MKVSFTTSFGTLVLRNFRDVLRNPILIKTRLIQTLFMGIYMGGIFSKFTGEYTSQLNWQALTGFFFYLGTNLHMLALGPVELVFP